MRKDQLIEAFLVKLLILVILMAAIAIRVL